MKSNSMKTGICGAALAGLFMIVTAAVTPALAAVPGLINFQGKLADSNGKAVTGVVPMVFKFYTTASGGSPAWTEIQNVTPDNYGIYSVMLGEVTPLNISFSTAYWLGVTVGTDSEMFPRYRIVASAYSLYALNSATAAWAEGADWSMITNKPAVTTQGNAFNVASQLVQMTSDNKLPSLDGSNLTNLIGAIGEQGIQGFTGATGAAGAIGNTGSTGAAGVTGIAGEIGLTGAQGIQGVTGEIGATGTIGTTGAIGATGSQGIQGATGVTGITGEIGLAGAQGIQGVIGSTGPAGTEGAIGAIGATGSQGIQGIIGLTGPDGTAGAQGIQGVIGSTGPAGTEGAAGATGAQGIQGIQGETGLTGPAGEFVYTSQSVVLAASTTFAADGSGVVLMTFSGTSSIATITGCSSGVVGQGQMVTFVEAAWTVGGVSFLDTLRANAANDTMLLNGVAGIWTPIADASSLGSSITLLCTTINTATPPLITPVKLWVEVGRSKTSD